MSGDWYSTGSVSDLSLDQRAFRSMFRSLTLPVLSSIFFFLARPCIKSAMTPFCSVVDLLKDFRRRYHRWESEGRIEFHPDIERAFGGDNPVFRDPFVLNAIDRKDQLAFIDYGSLLKTAAFGRSGQREDCAPDLRDAKPDIAPRRAATTLKLLAVAPHFIVCYCHREVIHRQRARFSLQLVGIAARDHLIQYIGIAASECLVSRDLEKFHQLSLAARLK